MLTGSGHDGGIKRVVGETVDQAHGVPEFAAPILGLGFVHLSFEEEIETKQPVQIFGRPDDGIASASKA